MEGITTYVFRNAISRHFGAVDCFYTPFLTASHIKGREMRDVDPKNNTVPRLVPQVLVNDDELFITITKQLEALGYDEVNLNLGCPSGTVTAKGRGAGFLDKVIELDRFLDKIFSKSPIDISIKTRIGAEFISEWEDIAEIYQKYPVKEMIIHPRTGKELYKGQAHVEIYKAMVDYLSPKMKDTIFTYNGDINDRDSLNDILSVILSQQPSSLSSTSLSSAALSSASSISYDERTDDDNFDNNIDNSNIRIMIGRGMIANPSLAYNLKNDRNIDNFKKRFLLFHEELLENYKEEMNYEDQVVKKMKELWVYLAKGLGIPSKAMKELLKANTITGYKNQFQVISSYILQ